MKLRTTVGALLEAHTTTKPTLDHKGAAANLYVQANEKSGFLYLYSTNLLSETATKIKAEIETPGEALVNPDKLGAGLAGLAKDTPVTLELTPTGNQLKVASGKVRFSLACSIDVKEIGNRMKSIPSRQEPAATVPATELIEFTKRTTFCLPNDQTGQLANLAVLRMSDTPDGGEEAYATDGSIIVHVSSPKKQSKGSLGALGLLIPTAALAPLAALVLKKRGQTIDIITIKNTRVFFKFADGTYFGALLQNSAYPNLRPIVDQTSLYKFEIGREAFKQALNRASLFVDQGTVKNSLELEFQPEAIVLKANGADSLLDEVPITYNGDKPTENVRLGLNISYLVNIFNGSHSENLTLGFTKENSPLTVMDKDGEDDERINVKYVVMGVRLGASK